MTAKELRDGNIVLHNGKFYVLDHFDIYKLDTTNCEDVEPIELTEEILLKCGFEKKQDYINGVGLCIFFEHKEFNYRLNQSFEVVLLKIKLKHLHQLQNLYFALTGKELEIQL